MDTTDKDKGSGSEGSQSQYATPNLLTSRSNLIRRMIRNLNSAGDTNDKKFVIKWALGEGLLKRSGKANVDGWTDEYTDMVYESFYKKMVNVNVMKYGHYSKLGGAKFSACLALHHRSKMVNVLNPKDVARRIAEQRSKKEK